MAIQNMIFGSNIDAIAVSIAMLILRVFVGALFIVHGAPKLYGPARKQMRDSMKQLGIPGPLFNLVGVLEFLGGIALIIGFLTRIASSLLALEMVGTTILNITKLYYAPIPRGYTESMFKATRGYMFGWELDSVLLASGLAIAIIGPGTISIDNLVLTKLR